MSAKCPICHNEYFIVKDLLFTGMGPQGVPLGSKVYIPKCSNCGYQLDPCSSEEEVLLRIRGFATDIDDEDTIACFFSSEIYGTEEACKKASEAQEELSSWQYERR